MCAVCSHEGFGSMGQTPPGPQGTPNTALVRIICFIIAVAAVGVAAYFQVTDKGVIATVIAAVIAAAMSAISGLGPWLLPLSPSNFASLQKVVSTRIKNPWQLLLFTDLIVAVASCVTWMVVTGTPLINMLLAAILIALSSLCLILVAIIDLVRKKGSGKGTKLSINWILLKLSVKQMLCIIVFLVLLILALSTSLFYTLRLPSLVQYLL